MEDLLFAGRLVRGTAGENHHGDVVIIALARRPRDDLLTWQGTIFLSPGTSISLLNLSCSAVCLRRRCSLSFLFQVLQERAIVLGLPSADEELFRY